MTSLERLPSSPTNFGPMYRKYIIWPSLSLAMRSLVTMLTLRRASSGVAPRGKIAKTRIFGLRQLRAQLFHDGLPPSAICSGVLFPELFVPIISTAALGEMLSMLP